ncbi:MAG: hypothetical protein ACRDDZ_11245 [Marinifilaceae bacterium]
MPTRLKHIVTAHRFEIGENGIDEIIVVWNRKAKKSKMTRNGKLEWEMKGNLAKSFFYKYGLLN